MMLASFYSVLLASALAVSATPKLSLSVSGAKASETSPDLKVVATLTNTGNETVRLLKDPRGILSNTPTNTFKITGVNGTSPAFNGVRLKYVPKYIVGSGMPELFTVLEPGKSLKVEHDLFNAYNFTNGGAGQYQVNARNLFLYVDPATNTTKRIYADVGAAHKVRVSHKKLAVNRRHKHKAPRRFVKRAGFRGCSDQQTQAILAAAPATKALAQKTFDYLTTNTAATPRYTTWWGEFTEARHSKVLEQYSKLKENDFEAFNYDCSCSEEGVFAFVYPDEFGVVNLCPAFWESKLGGTDSQAGTILHESSHFVANAGTDDHAYGQEACMELAQSDPDTAINNADSHEYFSENTPNLDEGGSTTPPNTGSGSEEPTTEAPTTEEPTTEEPTTEPPTTEEPTTEDPETGSGEGSGSEGDESEDIPAEENDDDFPRGGYRGGRRRGGRRGRSGGRR